MLDEQDTDAALGDGPDQDLAEARGLSVRESTSSSAVDFVNLVSLRGTIGERGVHVSGTLFGKRATPRIVGIHEHNVDLPPSSHMLVVRNSDTPGMIGTVGTILGRAGVNIADTRSRKPK